MEFKPLSRVIGIDDGYFDLKAREESILVGVVWRLDGRIEGILSQKIKVDRFDSTEKIISMISSSKFKSQAKFVLLHGVNFAGFNIADIKKINKKLRVPIIVCFRKKPNMKKIKKALSHLGNTKERILLIKRAGKIFSAEKIFFQFAGTKEQTARELIKKTLLYSYMPEPLRLAHLIASGITKPKRVN